MPATKSILITAWLAGGVGLTSLADPYAVEIIRAQGPFGPAPYDDAGALLGTPSTRFYDPFGPLYGASTNGRVKLVEAAYNIAADTNGLPTPNLLLTVGSGSEVVARFDKPVTNNRANPYGVDLLVFGNTFYTTGGSVSDTANMNMLPLTGGAFSERLKVSVSPGYTGQPDELLNDPDTWPWYRYDAGPYGDTVFPTQAFEWDPDTALWADDLMDFTKPVNPAMEAVISAGGLTAADAIELYDGAGGGTGFDLAQSGFDWIQYIKVDGIDSGFSVGEIDAFSTVAPRWVGDTLTVAPENIGTNPISLFFQWPTAPATTQLRLDFQGINVIARVVTTPITNFTSLPTLPGTPVNAVEVEMSRLVGNGNLSFEADIALSVGTAYNEDGGDLCVLQRNGTNWTELPFTFDPSTSQVLLDDVGSFSVFVVTQLTAPPIQLLVAGGNVWIHYDPVAGQLHTLERSTNMTTWTAIDTFVATNSIPVNIPDSTPPQGQAFYRLKMDAQ